MLYKLLWLPWLGLIQVSGSPLEERMAMPKLFWLFLALFVVLRTLFVVPKIRDHFGDWPGFLKKSVSAFCGMIEVGFLGAISNAVIIWYNQGMPVFAQSYLDYFELSHRMRYGCILANDHTKLAWLANYISVPDISLRFTFTPGDLMILSCITIAWWIALFILNGTLNYLLAKLLGKRFPKLFRTPFS